MDPTLIVADRLSGTPRGDLLRSSVLRSSEEHWNRLVIWGDGHAPGSWWVTPQVKEHDTIPAAVSRAGGISSRASVRVPHLLVGAVDRADANGTPSTVRIARAKGVECYVITVPFAKEREETPPSMLDEKSKVERVYW